MSEISKRAHIIPTTLDNEQVGILLDKVAADRVYIIDNANTVGFDKDIESLPKDRIEQVVKERTRCYENDEVYYEETDFYHYEEALIDCFRIIYKEDFEGNDIVIHLAGGTKPVAIALALACSLANAGQFFYVPKKYEQGDGQKSDLETDAEIEPIAAGPYEEEIFGAEPFRLLNIRNMIPSDENKQLLLKGFLEADSSTGVTDVLTNLELIDDTPPSDEDKKEERNRIIQRNHRYAQSLTESNLLEKQDSNYCLTYTGETIAQLVQIILEYE